MSGLKNFEVLTLNSGYRQRNYYSRRPCFKNYHVLEPAGSDPTSEVQVSKFLLSATLSV